MAASDFVSSLIAARQVDASTLTDPFLILTLIAAGAWLLQLAYFAFITRAPDVDAGPETSELSSESPALVNLLVNDARVTGAAVPATLLDLAVRDLVDIEEYGDAEEIIVRLRHNVVAQNLNEYTTMVLDHLTSKAVEGIVRAEALTLGPEGTSKSWMDRFRKLLQDEARAAGLTKPRWEGKMWKSLSTTGLAASALLLILAARYDFFWAGLFFACVGVFFVWNGVVQYFALPQLNPAGVQAASRWLGVRRFLEDNDTFKEATPGAVALWDSYMSYGAGMGLANDALRHLPMGEEDDEDAWSAYSGEWRHVTVAYPRVHIIWGKSPLKAIWTGMLMTAAGAGIGWLALQIHATTDSSISSDQQVVDYVKLGCLIALGVAVPLFLWGLHTMLISFIDLWGMRKITGQIIRMRSHTTSKGGGNWFLALYDGRASKVRAWRIGPTTYARVSQGNIIEATVSPRLGHLHSFRILPPATRAPAADAEAASI